MTQISRTAAARLKASAATFLSDENGGATIWNLTWLTGFVAMAGLSIDSTNAWRIETMLVSTADAASNAAAMDLPKPYLDLPYVHGSYVLAEDRALSYSDKNMDMDSDHGSIIERQDVYVGHWDRDSRTFEWGGEPVNAVQVHVGRNRDRSNAVATNFLRVLSLMGSNILDTWDVRATSTSLVQISKCLQDGLIAREGVDLASNLTIHAGMCIHGQNMVEIQNNVAWHESTIVTHGKDAYRKIQEGQYSLTPNPADAEHIVLPVIPHNLEPAMVDSIPTIAHGMMMADQDYAHFAQAPMPIGAPLPIIKLTSTSLTGSTSDEIVYQSGALEGPTTTDPVERVAPPGGPRVLTEALAEPDWDGMRVAGLGAGLGLAAKAGIQGPVPFGTEGYNLDNNNDAWVAKPNKGEYDNPKDTTDIEAGWVYDSYEQDSSVLHENHVYYMPSCKGGGNKLTISGQVRNVTIVSKCKIEITGTAELENVVIFAITEKKNEVESEGDDPDTYEQAKTSPQNAITIGEGAVIGRVDNCVGDGGVRLYTTKSVHAAASSKWTETQIIARLNIAFAGQTDAVQGLSAHAGRKIMVASNAVLGGMQNGTYVNDPTETSCITDGVTMEWTKFDFSYPIVD